MAYKNHTHIIFNHIISTMDTITFQDFLLKLSLHTSIIKHNSNHPNPNQKINKKMEQNLPIAAKKIWNAVRIVYFMLRKNISKPKLLADLNTMMKRSKIAGKAAMHNLMVHQHHSSADSDGADDRQIPPDVYEFSCSNTPAYPNFRLPFHLYKRKRSASPPPPGPSDADLFAAAMEIVSPALPGFERTPMVRQLRITDSPFPSRPEIEVDNHVDEAAEKFIKKFYRDLKRQNTMA